MSSMTSRSIRTVLEKVVIEYVRRYRSLSSDAEFYSEIRNIIFFQVFNVHVTKSQIRDRAVSHF